MMQPCTRSSTVWVSCGQTHSACASKSKMEFEELKIEIPTEEQEEQEEQEEGLQLPPKKYENKAGSFVTGFDVNSKEAIERKARRRKRFGVIEEEADKEKETEGKDDDDNDMILPKEIPKIPKGEMRQDALYVYGIDNMSTQDVFNYFEEFGPESIEWIDDSSCNVVWEDEHSAARALDSMGKSLIPNDTENNDSESVWKVGPMCKKAKCRLLLRFANKKDKKQPGAAKRSMYYLVHGYPGQFKGKKGIISKSRKRKILQEKERARHKYSGEPDVEFVEKMDEEEQESMEVDEPAMKVIVKNDRTLDHPSNEEPERLRMRMHADDIGKEKSQEARNKIHNRLQERLQERVPEKLQDRIQDRIQIEVDNTLDKNEGIDLRERLKSRRKHGFDFMDRPSLSIEIREEQS